MPSENEKPVFECRSRGVKGAVWAREKEGKSGGTYTEYSIQITKSYKDDAGNWHTTNNYFVNDLPHLELVTRHCFKYTALKVTEENNDY